MDIEVNGAIKSFCICDFRGVVTGLSVVGFFGKFLIKTVRCPLSVWVFLFCYQSSNQKPR